MGSPKLSRRARATDSSAAAESRPVSAEAIRSALTARELEIFMRLASGDSNQQIGRDLAVSENTVRNHVASILAKLQLENRVQAAVQAVRSGLSCVAGLFMVHGLSDEADFPVTFVCQLFGG
jgi:DNA-binding NarL/FixJ family response regulator